MPQAVLSRSMSGSARNLVLANAVTLAIAIALGWDVGWLMWPFWMQSVIIGWYARRRMLALHDFSTEGFKSNGKRVPETEQGKRSTANFFVMHYGFFHFAYLLFLVSEHSVHAPLEILVLATCGLTFIFSQRQTFTAQNAADIRGKPNLGTLMFLPYLRIIPMHLGVIFAGEVGGGTASLVIFVLLKTFADLGLDYADRRMAETMARPRVGGA